MISGLCFVSQTSLKDSKALRLRFSAGILGRSAFLDSLLGFGPLEWKLSLRARSGDVLDPAADPSAHPEPDTPTESGAAADPGVGGDVESPTIPAENPDAADSPEESRR